MSERTVEKTTKKCPGVGCGVPIAKNGGWYVFFFSLLFGSGFINGLLTWSFL